MARIVDGQIFECMFTNEFYLVNEYADATGVRCDFAGRTTKSWSMFLLLLFCHGFRRYKLATVR